MNAFRGLRTSALMMGPIMLLVACNALDGWLAIVFHVPLGALLAVYGFRIALADADAEQFDQLQAELRRSIALCERSRQLFQAELDSVHEAKRIYSQAVEPKVN